MVPEGRQKRTWRQAVQKDCQARKLHGGRYGYWIAVDGGS